VFVGHQNLLPNLVKLYTIMSVIGVVFKVE